MTFKGFSKKDFKTMQIPGLEARMNGIQTDIQPKFRAVGEELTTYLSAKLGDEMFYILLVTKDVQLTHPKALGWPFAMINVDIKSTLISKWVYSIIIYSFGSLLFMKMKKARKSPIAS